MISFSRDVCSAWRLGLAVLLVLSAMPLRAAERVPLTMALFPTTVVSSSVLQILSRDQILRDALDAQGLSLRSEPLAGGVQAVEAMKAGTVDMTVLGDLSVVSQLPQMTAQVVATQSLSFASVVARTVSSPADLAGRRIGITPDTVGAHALMRALAAARLSARDVSLVKLPVEALLSAMERGEIDAFAAWEPTPKQALSRHPDYRLVFRNANFGFLVMSDALVSTRPQAADALLAAFARAHRWLASDGRHVHSAVVWALQARQAYDGKPPPISVDEGVALLRAGVLDVVGLPQLPRGWVQPGGEGERIAFICRVRTLARHACAGRGR